MKNAVQSNSASLLYFEDFKVGMKFSSNSIQISAEQIIKFAEVYDPQPFHTDPERAVDTFFNGLAASGWHTAALTMQLLTDGTLPICWGIVGAGADELRWPNPLRPGDSIHLECEVIEFRLLKTRDGMGIVRVQVNTINQNNEPVQTLIPKMLVPTRASQSGNVV